MASMDMAKYMRKRRSNRRSSLLELRGSRCEKCGSEDGLEFNHLDRTKKSFNLSGCDLDKSWDRILEELNKCELLCEVCHNKYTADQYSSGEIESNFKGLDRISGETVILEHGMTKMYNEGCRCSECRYAKSLYRQKLIGYTDKVNIPQ